MEWGDIADHDNEFHTTPQGMTTIGPSRVIFRNPGHVVEPEHSALAPDRRVAARRLAEDLEAKNVTIEGDGARNVADEQFGAQAWPGGFLIKL